MSLLPRCLPLLFASACAERPLSLDLDPGESASDESTSNSGEPYPSGRLPEAPMLQLSLMQVKQFEFTWEPVAADYYQLIESPEIDAPYAQVGADIAADSIAVSITVPLYFRVGASYRLRACNAAGCADSDPVAVVGSLAAAVGYFKASNTGADDRFGESIALSADGNTLAVGADAEDSSARGVEGDQSDDAAAHSGAVYVFTRFGGGWAQQAYLKAPNSDPDDYFGDRLALSADGNTLAVGAMREDSGGDPGENFVVGSGAVHVFTRAGGSWSPQAYIKASDPAGFDGFGASIGLSADGETLAVGAKWEDSNATGIDGQQDNIGSPDSGAVYVFTRAGDEWSQQAYLKASNTSFEARFGFDVALAADGATLAVGAIWEDRGGDTTEISLNSGAVYVFTRADDEWSQQAYLKAPNLGEDDYFGYRVALSGDGGVLAVSAVQEDSGATGIDGDPSDDSTLDSGAVYVFTRAGEFWSQQAYLKASTTHAGDHFGMSIALSADGEVLAVSADGEDSGAIGVDEHEGDHPALDSGAVHVFTRSGEAWSQRATLKASNTGEGDGFGSCIALSADGDTLAVGAAGEDGGATGIGGAATDDERGNAGAVYLY